MAETLGTLIGLLLGEAVFIFIVLPILLKNDNKIFSWYEKHFLKKKDDGKGTT